jgi:hypothetical protein
MPTQQSPKRGLSFLSFSNLLNRMSHFELAQINIARFVQPKADASNLPFMDALDAVNAEAEASPGFLWRLVGDGNNATDVEAVPGDSRLIVNMSVWSDMASLSAFAYRNKPHVAVFRRKHEWFEPMAVSLALWWVPAGYRPSATEGIERLEKLARLGPTPEAFTFKSPFAPPVGHC